MNKQRAKFLSWPRSLAMAGVGGYILHHEVVVAQNSELTLVIVGLWLIGAPIVQLLDWLREATELRKDIMEPGQSHTEEPEKQLK